MTKLRHLIAPLALLVALAGCGGPATVTRGQAMQPGFAAAMAADGRVQVLLHFSNPRQLDAMAKAGVDLFENVNLETGTVGATLTTETAEAVERIGVKFQISQSEGRLKGKKQPTDYETVDAIYKDIAAVAAAHPQFIKLETIGKSVQGRPLLALRFTSKPEAKLPATRIGAGMHAREMPPVDLAMRFVHHLAAGYGKDAAVTKLVDTRDIWIVPVQNPDGRVNVEQGEAMWRKNMRELPKGMGVDCNRNTDNHFGEASDNPRADDYRGTSAFSEPETRALRDLATRVHFKTSVDLHCYGGMILWPPGHSRDFSKDEASFAAIGKKLAPSGYRAGTIARTIYLSYADFATWEYEALGTMAFGAELDVSSFSPPYDEAKAQWTAWKPKLMYIIEAAGATKGPGSELNVFPSW